MVDKLNPSLLLTKNMIYHLAQKLQTTYTFLNLFHYVSVRAIGAFLTGFLFSLMFGDWFIRACREHFGSKVREFTPATHQKKNNTPTMGGLFILIVFVCNTLLWNKLTKPSLWIFLLGIIGFGCIGFVDDWNKIKAHKGLSAKRKFLLQLSMGLTVMTVWYFWAQPNTAICVPFVKNIDFTLGWLIIPWGAFIIIATSNAVNLTDGLDGLATGPLIVNCAAFALIVYLAGHKAFSEYLYIPFAGSAEISIIAASLVGVLLGFLWYNTYPAQIFMGDVGSLALGAGLALMAIMARQEFLLLISGGIFVLETASVIIQVLSFKFLGRRMFRMAPIHHHFELKGWQEAKITVRFWIISIVLCVLALLTLKIR